MFQEYKVSFKVLILHGMDGYGGFQVDFVLLLGEKLENI